MAEGNWPLTGSPRPSAPAELQDLQGWLIWRVEHDPGSDKALKIPYWPSGGRRYGKQGSPQDRAQLTTFAAARDAAARRGFDGVGFAPLPEFGITALDFDRCVDEGGNLPPEIEEITQRTYAEYSPSGKGIRAFLKGDLGNRKAMPDSRYGWGFEVFSSKLFVTVTGNVLETTEQLGLENVLAPIDQPLLDLCEKRFGPQRRLSPTDDFMDSFEPPLGMSESEIEAYLSELDPSMGRDGWIRVGMALHHETEGEGFALWDTWSSGGHQYPGTEALERQWSSFSRRDPDGRQVTMRTVVRMATSARAVTAEHPLVDDVIARAIEVASVAANDNPDIVATPPGFTGKYRIVGAAEFAQAEPLCWIVKGILPRADLGVVYGAPASGKSAFVLDLALAIARGVEWRGRPVVKGRVVYLAAEGAGGVTGRLLAYGQRHGIDLGALPFGVLAAQPNLLGLDDVSAVVSSVVAAGGADLIIIDTLAQVMPGADENSSKDMGMALSHARSIRGATGAMVLLVHHSGKDASRGARGWSGLRGAADVEIEVSEDRALRRAEVTKLKDGPEGGECLFELDPVNLGEDADGDPITSIVVRYVEGGKRDKAAEVHGSRQRALLAAIQDFADFGDAPVLIERVLDRALERQPLEPGRDPSKPDKRRSNFRVSLRGLISKGIVHSDGERASLLPIAT